MSIKSSMWTFPFHFVSLCFILLLVLLLFSLVVGRDVYISRYKGWKRPDATGESTSSYKKLRCCLLHGSAGARMKPALAAAAPVVEPAEEAAEEAIAAAVEAIAAAGARAAEAFFFHPLLACRARATASLLPRWKRSSVCLYMSDFPCDFLFLYYQSLFFSGGGEKGGIFFFFFFFFLYKYVSVFLFLSLQCLPLTSLLPPPPLHPLPSPLLWLLSGQSI